MKVYIAARATTRIDDVKKIQARLAKMGYSITYDWANDDNKVARPYRHPKSRAKNAKAIPKMLKAAADADIFILLDEPGLRGAYIEYGAYLWEAVKHPINKKVFIVGANSSDREHIFESPEYVFFVDTIEKVYDHLTQPRLK